MKFSALVRFATRGVSLAFVTWAVATAVAEPPRREPNILLISIDSLRADHVHSYGYPRDTTPHIDRLAREGVRFETALSASSWTLPSHMTLLTALAPPDHRVKSPNSALRDEVVTLAEVLQRRGYATAAFVAGPFLQSLYGFARGFDTYDESVMRRGNASHRGHTSPRLLDLVRGWLSGWRSTRRPFFVFLHMWDPHYDYAPPPPYDTLYDPDYAGEVDGRNFAKNPAIHAEMDPRDLEHLVALYDGEIRYTDEHIGELLALLEHLGVDEDTIVVVTSDHGDEFFEHGAKGHAKTLYDEIIRVPLVLRYPRAVPSGQLVREQVRAIDVAPTILGLTGVRGPSDFGAAADGVDVGRDLSPWLAANPAPEGFPVLLGVSMADLFDQQVSVRDLGTKYVLTRNWKGKTRREVFDLGADPRELRNLSRQDSLPDKIDSHAEVADSWLQHSGGPNATERRVKIPKRQVDQLQALGYIE